MKQTREQAKVDLGRSPNCEFMESSKEADDAELVKAQAIPSFEDELAAMEAVLGDVADDVDLDLWGVYDDK